MNIWRSCVRCTMLLTLNIWRSCVRCTMLLSLYICWERVMCSIHNIVVSIYVCLLGEDCVFDPQYCCLCIFVERAYWIYEGSVFHPRFSLYLWGQRSTEYMFLCSIHTPVFDWIYVLSIFVGYCVSLYLCWESCSISLCIFVSLLGELLYIFVGRASDWIYFKSGWRKGGPFGQFKLS